MILHGHVGTLASALVSIVGLSACVIVAQRCASPPAVRIDAPRRPPGLAAEAAYVAGLLPAEVEVDGAPSGLRAVIARRDPRGGYAYRHECRGAGAMSEPRVAVEEGGAVAVAITFEGAIDCGVGPILAAGGPNDFDAIVMKLDPQGSVRWIRSLSGAGPQALAAVAIDPWGSVIVAGTFEGAVSLGGPPLTAEGERDALLVALDPDGRFAWQRRFGGAGRSYGVDVDVARSGRVLLLARASSSLDAGTGTLPIDRAAAVVAAFDRGGHAAWSRVLGGAGEVEPSRVRALPGNRALVTGTFVGEADFGAGPITSAGRSDAFAAQLDANGALIGAAHVGETVRDAGATPLEELPSLALHRILDELTGNPDCPSGPPSCGAD